MPIAKNYLVNDLIRVARPTPTTYEFGRVVDSVTINGEVFLRYVSESNGKLEAINLQWANALNEGFIIGAKYEVGDVVRVRDFDDMAKQFGVVINECGEWRIPCPATFTEEMEKFCGKLFRITRVGKTTDYIYYRAEPVDTSEHYGGFGIDFYTITEPMVIRV